MRQIEVSPHTFYAIVDLIKEHEDPGRKERVKSHITSIDQLLAGLDDQVLALEGSVNAMSREVRVATMNKGRGGVGGLEDDRMEELLGRRGRRRDFLSVCHSLAVTVRDGYQQMRGVVAGLQPGRLMVSSKRVSGFETTDDIQRMSYEFQLNRGVIERFVAAAVGLEDCRQGVVDVANRCIASLESYYQGLLARHSVEGVKIHVNPVLTDVAMTVYENVDAHGELEDGKSVDEVSAYTRRKAELIAEAVREPLASSFINDPDELISMVQGHVKALWELAELLTKDFADLSDSLSDLTGDSAMHYAKKSFAPDAAGLRSAVGHLSDLNPMNIRYREKAVVLTSEERFNLQFQNETVGRIAQLLSNGADHKEVVRYVMERKVKLRDYFQTENSFYTCKIGHGNPFMGEPPGALQVVPASRPNVNLDEILGSGFSEVKGFIGTIEAASEWHDLFVATSPSKTSDKSNVLLVGPQGCGKSEILRAVGGDRKSIGVFAQGSDFLTCWKGEAEKNPKRMFEACVKLQKESRKHVHILIDEIDSVLNRDREFGATNLTLEFQILMDGVVHYPHLSVWGATNFPDRIPMPMIRRFSKVLIVGELSQQDRVKLLKQFVGYMPTRGFEDRDWEGCAESLDGAVGDVIRKVVDHVWRSKMNWFVHNHQREARDLTARLSQGGVKFQVSEFDSARREDFKRELARYMAVTPDDLRRSVEEHLENIAVHNEIQTAREVYANAKAFLEQLRSKRGS